MEGNRWRWVSKRTPKTLLTYMAEDAAPDPKRSSTRAPRLIGEERDRCIYCGGTKITREGKRHKQLKTVQLWYCRTCDRVFTPQRAKGKRYPLKAILESREHIIF
jgi:hypothetical protein